MASWKDKILNLRRLFSGREKAPAHKTEVISKKSKITEAPPRKKAPARKAEVLSKKPKAARAPPMVPSDLPPLEINLGIDFGTRFSKVCYRNVARQESCLVNLSNTKDDWLKSLVPSEIFLNENEQLILIDHDEKIDPEVQGWQRLDYLKMLLAGINIRSDTDPSITKIINEDYNLESLCAWYLSQLIIKTKKWIRKAEKKKLEGRRVRWTANIGVPVEFFDSEKIDVFKKVASMAWQWSEEDLSDFCLPDLRRKYIQEVNALEPDLVDCSVIPEIAAAVQAFISSREARQGTYVYFDIGAGTLDSVSFRYHRHEGVPNIDFYFGKVQPLGVNAISGKISKLATDESDIDPKSIESMIMNKIYREINHLPISEMKDQIQTQVVHTLDSIRQNDPRAWEEARFISSGFIPTFILNTAEATRYVFIGGGGMQSDFYKRAIADTYTDRKLYTISIPAFSLIQVPAPSTLIFNGIPKDEFHRFAVAYGLSFPRGEGPEIRLPSRTGTVVPTPVNRRIKPVDYRDTKDIYD